MPSQMKVKNLKGQMFGNQDFRTEPRNLQVPQKQKAKPLTPKMTEKETNTLSRHSSNADKYNTAASRAGRQSTANI